MMLIRHSRQDRYRNQRFAGFDLADRRFRIAERKAELVLGEAKVFAPKGDIFTEFYSEFENRETRKTCNLMVKE
jgi:hypothetical protein